MNAKTFFKALLYMFSRFSLTTKVAWIIVIFLLGIFIIRNTSIVSHDSSIQSIKQQSSVPTAQDLFNRMTAADHLKEAQKALNEWKPNKDPMKTSWGGVSDARKHLAAIPQNTPESAEKDKLLKEVVRREKEIEKVTRVVAYKIMVQQRKEFAKKYELSLLDAGMDTTITTLGKNHSTLRIKWVLMSRPLVYKLINDGATMANLRKLGFEKVVFTDGYDRTWTSDLTK